MATTRTAVRKSAGKVQVKRERIYAPTGDIGRRILRAQALQNAMEKLKAEYDELRADLCQHMLANQLDTCFAGDARASLKTRHNWVYAPQTERQMQQVRLMQKRDIADGSAVDNPTVYTSVATVPSI